MKQTAVQWYAIESGKLEVERAKGYLTFSQMFDKMLEIFKQAKAMEKEQIIESFSYGIINHHDAFKNENKFGNGEQYYEQTFKSE